MGVAAMRGALKSVTYNLKRGRHFRERRRERRSERRECPEGAETHESSTAAGSSSSLSDEGSGSDARGLATLADATQDRQCLWPREFGIFDGGVAAWPHGGGPRQRALALAPAQEFTE